MKLLKKSLLILVFLLISSTQTFAFWMWTPETGKFVNPKYSVKDTPSEQLEYALVFHGQKQYEEAGRELKKLMKHYPKAREAAEAQFYLGVMQEEQGNLFKAFEEYQVVIEKYPFSERAASIVKRQYEMGIELLEGKEEKSKFMDSITGADYDVVDIFRTVITNAPYGEYAAVSQYKIGIYLLEKQLYQEARDEFEKLVNDYPNDEWAKAAQYQIAITDAKRSSAAQYDQKVTESAIAEFEEFLEEYPEAELSNDAKEQISKLREKEAENSYVVAQFYEKQKKYEAAKIYYQAVVNDFSDTVWAKKALLRIREVGQKDE
jgi:outer membrane assembly lipoprotein YfiO